MLTRLHIRPVPHLSTTWAQEPARDPDAAAVRFITRGLLTACAVALISVIWEVAR